MAYVKIMFQDSPSTATPMNARNLNHMDDQIALNDQRLTEIETSYVKSFNGRKGDVTAQSGDYNIGQIAPLTGAQVGQVPVVVNHGTEEDPELVFEMGAGGGGGHSIIDSEGNTMPQETAMQFADSFVSDDETNGITIVENIKEVSPADYDSTTDEGIIVCDDGNDVPIGEIEEDVVSVTADGVKTYAQLLTELKGLIDNTKLQYYSEIVLDKQTSVEIHDIVYWDANVVVTACVFTTYGGVTETDTFYIGNSVKYQKNIVGNVTDMSSEKPTNGTKLTLHYGNKKAVVDLQTTSNRCLRPNGVTVEAQLVSILALLNMFNYPTKTLQNVDINTVFETGIYRLNGNITNSASGNYGVLIVFGVANTECRQIQLPSGSNSIYTRTYGTGVWNSFSSISMT